MQRQYRIIGEAGVERRIMEQAPGLTTGAIDFEDTLSISAEPEHAGADFSYREHHFGRRDRRGRAGIVQGMRLVGRRVDDVRAVIPGAEAVHAVQRAVHSGKIPTELAKRPESLAAVSSSLSLLTNALMAWNTQHMQCAVERIETIGGEKLSLDDLRRIAPTNLEGINLRGTFDFHLAAYAMRILPSSAAIDHQPAQKRSL